MNSLPLNVLRNIFLETLNQNLLRSVLAFDGFLQYMLDYMIQQFLLALISRNLVPFSNKTSQFLDQNMLMPVIALRSKSSVIAASQICYGEDCKGYSHFQINSVVILLHLKKKVFKKFSVLHPFLRVGHFVNSEYANPTEKF